MRPASRGVAICTAVALISGVSACAGPTGSTVPLSSAPISSVTPTPPSASVAPSPTATSAADASANPAEVVQGEPYQPEIQPDGFTTAITNPYLPLVPGTVWTYAGGDERVETAVTDQTKIVMGIETVVVRDRAFEGDALVEDTLDWFAQDAAGNVWYFGEDTAECEDGRIASRHGAWEAGVDGAQPGVVMLAQPAVGAYYRQEFLKGEAEDVARVLDTDTTVKAGSRTYRDVVVTEDFTALEPDVVEHKAYAATIGLVQAKTVKGGKGVERLTDVQTGVPTSSMPTGKLCRP